MRGHASFIVLLVCLAAASTNVCAQDERHHEVDAPYQAISLSDELTELLRMEMAAIQEGMQALIPAIASGNWRLVAEIGNKLHDSYIMQAKLSDQQRQELHESLPAAFREMDHEFHHSAKLLADAAGAGNAEVVTFYLQRLTESCVACHRRFASTRFPGLAQPIEQKTHHH